jgi:hypothetical protein
LNDGKITAQGAVFFAFYLTCIVWTYFAFDTLAHCLAGEKHSPLQTTTPPSKT